MNRPIRILSIGCLLLFLALLVNANYVQFVQADDLNDRAGNRRVLDEQFSRDRGPILVDGDPIARSVDSDDEYDYQRSYPSPYLYAHLTGFYSYTYGSSQLEHSENDILSGDDDRLFVNRVVDLVGNDQPQGGNVTLTIDPKAQKVAQEGLADLDRFGPGFKGSVVALDPKTGAVLAMVNRPSYNPNDIATHDLEASQKAYEKLLEDKSRPMDNRAATETVPPGSTFKLVTAAAALDSLDLKSGSKVYGGETYDVNGYSMPNVSEGSCSGGDETTLRIALMNSCNTSFGWLAVKMGEDALEKQAEKFGFGQDYLSGLTTQDSRFTVEGAPSMTDNEDLLAKSGIGQQDIAATPLQMAMVTAGVANDGEVMEPYVVDEVRSPDFDTLDKADPHPIDDQPAMSEGDAKELQGMLVDTATEGTAVGVAEIPGVEVGAKTGTAQRGEGQSPYSWFVEFAPADDPKVAVAVMVDPPLDYGSPGTVTGGGYAGPIANQVAKAVIE
ncbi:penicillin-binding protein 2 [Nocardioidaceae bacterium SCSIO 66511]|nr:penicillin-binding protein 2 [Nocardioidaceae bacterium SCSIO 66511]